MSRNTVDISRTPAWQTLRPGDPWTFIRDEPIRLGMIEGVAVAEVGHIIEWLPDGAPAGTYLAFKVIRIERETVYECIHIAQPPAFRGNEGETVG